MDQYTDNKTRETEKMHDSEDISGDDIKKITSAGATLLIAIAASFVVYGSIMLAVASVVAFLLWTLFIVAIASIIIHKVLRWGWRSGLNKRLWLFAILAVPATIVIMVLLLNFSPSFDQFMIDL